MRLPHQKYRSQSTRSVNALLISLAFKGLVLQVLNMTRLVKQNILSMSLSIYLNHQYLSRWPSSWSLATYIMRNAALITNWQLCNYIAYFEYISYTFHQLAARVFVHIKKGWNIRNNIYCAKNLSLYFSMTPFPKHFVHDDLFGISTSLSLTLTFFKNEKKNI